MEEKLRETMFEVMLEQELSAVEENSQHKKALHHTRFFVLKEILEECDLLQEYYSWRADIMSAAAAACAAEGVA